jgi:Ca2+-binding EF-hand superfamily protein
MNLRKSAFVPLAVAAFGFASLPLIASADQNRPRHNPGERMEALDTNGDGDISREEVDAVRAERFAATDTDGDGLISAEEFSAAAEAREVQQRAERHAAIFEHLDTDGDGTLSNGELSPQIDHMFSMVDSDEDGVITLAEREATHEAMRARWRDHRGERGERGDRWQRPNAPDATPDDE